MRLEKRRCDRCESEYEPHPNVLPDTTIIPAMYRKVKSSMFGTSVQIEIKDMCDGCLTGLQNWWDNIIERR